MAFSSKMNLINIAAFKLFYIGLDNRSAQNLGNLYGTSQYSRVGGYVREVQPFSD